MPTRESIVKEFAEVIHKRNLECLYGANVPDFLLADVALKAVESFCESFAKVCTWYGAHLEPGNKFFVEGT